MSHRSLTPRGLPPWLRVAGVMFGVAWGANQFSSLLLAYRLHLGVSESTADALFGVYALGLIPALLVLGPISDARGRRAIVAGAGLLSVLATVALIAGEHAVSLLYVGRFAAGVCSGAAFASGTAQIKELSSAPYDPGAGEQAGARRAAIALSGGFGLGALVAGLVAQWAPDPLVVAYVPHLIVMAITMPLLIGAPETIVSRQPVPNLRTILRVPSAGHIRFRRIVAPAAPWVFAAPAISFAVLPGLVSHQTGSFEVGFAALIAGLTLALGVLIQPLARRLDAVGDVRGTLTGLTAVTAGVLLGALAGAAHSWPLVVPAAILLGCGYGLCLVSGLLEIQRLASHEDLASLTAVFYALTYIGFAAPIVLAELERLTSATVLLVCVAGVAAFTAVEVAVAGSVSFGPEAAVMAPEAWVYLLRCGDGSLYTGWTTDLDRRLARHQAGTASRYTASRLPVALALTLPMESRTAARREEARIKRLTRRAKLALVDQRCRSAAIRASEAT